jgi:hypothetical protein
VSIKIKSYQPAREIPEGVQRLLDSCPLAGQGVHPHIFKAALALKGWVTHERAFELLIQMAVRARRSNCRKTQAEVSKQLSAAWSGQGVETIRSAPKVEADLERINQIVITAYGGNESPQQVEKRLLRELGSGEALQTTCRCLQLLFPGDPWLCMGRGEAEHDCRRLSEWELDRCTAYTTWEFIVPSAQLGRLGMTSEGKLSTHALSNCGPRQYLVCEFDIAEYARDKKTPTLWLPLVRQWREMGVSVTQAQLALIHHISRNQKPAMIVHSGGKSLHTWYATGGRSDEELRPEFEKLIRLGADPRTWTKSQFVRTPGAKALMRDKQRVLAFNVGALEGGAK